MNRILIVDDDRDLAAMLATFFQHKGVETHLVHQSGDLPSDLSGFDAILLDINLPGEDGYSICQRLRRDHHLPIIFISARTSEADIIKGLMIGGDDYLAKPFSLEELYARVYASLRHLNKRQPVVKFGLDREQFQVEISGRVVELTRLEFDILDLLYSNAPQVFSKERIYDQLWGYDAERDAQVVAEHIRNIRNKLRSLDRDNDYIKTIWGVGYSWRG